MLRIRVELNAACAIISLGVLLTVPELAKADIGLMVYDSNSSVTFTSNTGHAGVYLSNVCPTGQFNKFMRCSDRPNPNDGVTGTLIQRYPSMSPDKENFDWIALPLNINLYGRDDKADAPIVSTKATLRQAQNDAFHRVDLNLPKVAHADPSDSLTEDREAPGKWNSAIGINQTRTSRMVSLPTTLSEDQKVVDFLNSDQNISTFNLLRNNCANFANEVFKVAKGDRFDGSGKFEDAFRTTPLSDAKGVKKFAKEQNLPYKVTTFNQSPGTFRGSVAPGEILTESNTGLLVTLPLRAAPSPTGMLFTGLKLARKLGLGIPGFRNYLDLKGKETRNHGSDDLAVASLDLDQSKSDLKKDQKAHDDEKIAEDKTRIAIAKDDVHGFQSKVFGTKACWKDKKSEFKDLISRALAAGVINPAYADDFKMHETRNKILRMIPMLYLNPNHGKLIDRITSERGAQIVDSPDGTVLVKDGVTAGMTRANIGNHDPKLGFLIMAASLIYQLDSSQTLLTEEFDQDWKKMLELGQKSGLKFSDQEVVGVQVCSNSELSAKNVADEEVVSDNLDQSLAEQNLNCADCNLRDSSPDPIL